MIITEVRNKKNNDSTNNNNNNIININNDGDVWGECKWDQIRWEQDRALTLSASPHKLNY